MERPRRVDARALMQFRVGKGLAPRLAERVVAQRGPVLAPSMVVKRDIIRYYELLELAWDEKELKAFTDEEVALVREVANRREPQPQGLWAAVLDEMEEDPELFRSYYDSGGLVARLRSLNPGQLYALWDRIER